MATLDITVNADISGVELLKVQPEMSNSCVSRWDILVINCAAGDTVLINATGTYDTFDCDDANYVFNTNFVLDADNPTLNTILENSGTMGVYNSIFIEMTNVTTGASDDKLLTRFNDGGIC